MRCGGTGLDHTDPENFEIASRVNTDTHTHTLYRN